MKRAVAVITLAVLMAALSGIEEVSLTPPAQASGQADARVQKIANSLQAIPVGSAIEIEPTKGKKFQALLEDVAPDAITVRVVSGASSLSRTIPLDEIKNLKKINKMTSSDKGSKVARNVLIGFGIAVGVCTASLAIAQPSAR
jgi:hypothetical protein